MYNCLVKLAHYRYLSLQELTYVSFLCLHCTPHSISHSRPCSHFDIILSARCQSRHNGRVVRRRARDDVLIDPGRSPMYPVLKNVLSNGLITLRDSPVCLQKC